MVTCRAETVFLEQKTDQREFDFEIFKSLISPNPEQNSGFISVNPKILFLNQNQFTVFVNLLKYRNRETGCAFLRGSKIGITERQIRRIFNELEERSLIKKENPGSYNIPIHDSKGQLFPCFTRWFWNSFVKKEYLEFRLAVFLRLTNLKTNTLTSREIRDGLKCRVSLIQKIKADIETHPEAFFSLKENIRHHWDKSKFIANSEEKSVLKLAKTSENLVSPMSQSEPNRNQKNKNFDSPMSDISSKAIKEDLTKPSQSFFNLKTNFKEIGLPDKEIHVSKIEEEAIRIKEYQDILSEKEITFLLILTSYLLKQTQFKQQPIELLISQIVNLILNLKVKATRLRLNRSILDYFCGTLLVILETNPSTFEITRMRERIKERAEMSKTNNLIETNRRELEDKKSLISIAIYNEIKVHIPGWELMSEAILASKIGFGIMEGGALFNLAKKVEERLTMEYKNA